MLNAHTSSHKHTLIQSLLQGFSDFSPQNESPKDPAALSSQRKTPGVISGEDHKTQTAIGACP